MDRRDKVEFLGGKSRILFYEPNDSFEQINGAPITPDYGEMNISFALVVEVVDRLASSEHKVANKEYVITWVSHYDKNGNLNKKDNYVSFMQGDDSTGTPYLTTYYTETSFDDIRKKSRIVEGLGVSNVTVAFENYYAPTATIKFVDQRGSALFGREEAYHENDVLTAETVFGCFFTQPYPKFRLQIKGFFGQPVTYQLVCSGFRGNLNPSTGNFEATVSFIGYQYGILTDIPFNYIVAAPYCDYAGRAYWASHVDSDDWQIIRGAEGKPIPTLYSLFRGIEKTLGDDKLLKELSEYEDESASNTTEKSTRISNILSTLRSFITEIYRRTGAHGLYQTREESESEYQIMLTYSEEGAVSISDELKSAYKTLKESIKDYNDAYTDDSIVPSSGSIIEGETLSEFTPVRFFKPPETDNGTYSYLNGNTFSRGGLRGKTVQDGGPKITEGMSKVIYDETSNPNLKTAAPYAYLFTFGSIFKDLNDTKVAIKEEEKKVKTTLDQKYLGLAQNNLGVVPYIGNIFHILMAHLETFTHIMYRMNEIVMSNQSLRTPSALGMNGIVTDTVYGKCKYVPSWPAIFKNSGQNNIFASGEKESDVLGWVGDISHSFEEEKLIKALYSASYKTGHGGESDSTFKRKIYHVPVNGFDIVSGSSPFIGFGTMEGSDNIKSSLGGMLGFRATQLFGIMDPDLAEANIAEQAGKMDGYSFYIHDGNKEAIKELITDQTGGNADLKTELIDIMTCSKDGDKYALVTTEGRYTHTFETAYAGVHPMLKQKRHPVLVKNGDDYDYVHYTSKSRYGMVPKNILRPKKNGTNEYTDPYSKMYTQQAGNGTPYYKVTEEGFSGSVFRQTLDKIREEMGEGSDGWVNNNRFIIYADNDKALAVIDKYNELKEGKVRVGTEVYEDDFSGVLDRYWAYVNKYYDNFSIKTRTSEVGSYGTIVPAYRSLNPELKALSEGNGVPSNTCKDFLKVLGVSAKVTYDKNDGSFTFKDNKISTDSLILTDVEFYTFGKDRFEKANSLFGCQTYLMNREDPYAQAYLFIVSLPVAAYSGSLFPHDCGVSVIYYSSILVAAAHVWRYVYMEEHDGQDPIKHNGEQYKTPSKTQLYRYSYNSNEVQTSCVIKTGANKTYMTLEIPESQDEIEYLLGMFEDFVNGDTWKNIRRLSDIGIDNLAVFIDEICNLRGNVLIDNMTTDEKKTYLEAIWSKFKANIKNFGTSFKHADITVEMQDEQMTTDDNGLYFLLSDNGELQRLINSVLFRKCVSARSGEADNSSASVGENSDTHIKGQILENYLNGFVSTLKKVVNGETRHEESPEDAATEDENGIRYERDIMISMYKYLKNIWDKWLVQEKPSTYTVKEFFFSNFKFIDSAYRNIYSRMMINCQAMYDRYNSVKEREDVTLFKFIGDIVTDHHCMFLALPDFVTFSSPGENENEAAKNKMKDIFSPLSYDRRPPIRQQNYFIVVYVPNLASTPSGKLNAYQDETLNIWSQNGVPSNLPDYFVKTNFITGSEWDSEHLPAEPWEEVRDRYGYNVPAFSVAFGRQNNHLFKNVKLNMDSPVITSAVINTLSHIAMKGSGNSHSIALIGQDIYPVFSNYSYQAEVEMMGDAQIHPLMYFQLMNVPMWRGTYMIFNVTHNMSPGTMTTTFKGMKLGNYAVDYSSVWFTKKVNFNEKEGQPDPCEVDSNPTDEQTYGGNGITDYSQIKNHKMRQMLGLEPGTRSQPFGIDQYYYTGTKKPQGLYSVLPKKNGPNGRGDCGYSVISRYRQVPGFEGLTAWGGYGAGKIPANYVIEHLKKWGFVLYKHGTPAQAKQWDRSSFNIGDIGVSFSNKSEWYRHMQMWDGKDWRSDFVQNGIWVFGSDNGREDDYAFCIFRHPEFQESTSSPSATTVDCDPGEL